MLNIFNFGVATEANDYFVDIEDEIWVRDTDGNLIPLEDETDEDDTEGK